MAGLLTCGSTLSRSFPGKCPVDDLGSLAAYSCGGSHGIGHGAAPYSLLSRPQKAVGNHRGRQNMKHLDSTRARSRTLLLSDGSVSRGKRASWHKKRGFWGGGSERRSAGEKACQAQVITAHCLDFMYMEKWWATLESNQACVSARELQSPATPCGLSPTVRRCT